MPKTTFCLTLMVSVPFLCSFLSRTGWFGTVVEYGAERKISRHSVLSATVSVGVPQGVTLKIKYWPTQNMIMFSFRFVQLLMSVSMQDGTCQSDLPVSSPSNRSAFAQCCLLCHCGTPADLHGHPPADHHPIHSSPERRVSTHSVLSRFICTWNNTRNLMSISWRKFHTANLPKKHFGFGS